MARMSLFQRVLSTGTKCFIFYFLTIAFRPLDIATLSGETVELSLRSEFNEDAAWKTVGQQETDSSGRCSFQLDSDIISRCGIYKARFTVLGDGSQVNQSDFEAE